MIDRLSILDPADDGPEIAAIRAVTGRTQEWYDMIILAALGARHIEDIQTSNAELEFCRKVGLL